VINATTVHTVAAGASWPAAAQAIINGAGAVVGGSVVVL
jgi:hypothetical protein